MEKSDDHRLWEVAFARSEPPRAQTRMTSGSHPQKSLPSATPAFDPLADFALGIRGGSWSIQYCMETAHASRRRCHLEFQKADASSVHAGQTAGVLVSPSSHLITNIAHPGGSAADSEAREKKISLRRPQPRSPLRVRSSPPNPSPEPASSPSCAPILPISIAPYQCIPRRGIAIIATIAVALLRRGHPPFAQFQERARLQFRCG